MGLSMATAALWVERWERQQQRYAVDREERFTVIADIVEHVVRDEPNPLVVDLGCGPGSLAARLVRRLPHAEIVAVDRDPLLLELGRTHHAAAAQFVEATIGADGWVRAMALDRPLDAVVSTTALHCLPVEVLADAYRQFAALVRPGGVLVNSDHFEPGGDPASRIAVEVGRRRAERRRPHDLEDWTSWWAAAADEPELAQLLTDQPRPSSAHHNPDNGLPLSHHVELLRRAGFQHICPVWQFGTGYVLVAVR
ncbi:class I SAM-dependent methyltransferase [Streptantibioticus rubrisoli]|uniref:Class I SAM-dependent methyltransferase n=1 Tax=Streptantibioticus rubrisoli TaxID=1387313 RepID=A0ABT1P6H0_9ACTN|nr:class I SAM-dependent methyltransferase [Streptantibioticus rubrisoli]MCQ4040964.1 class I SAM-dependent methyltransferase [Streptantibioticus rubrisoli]